MISATGKRKRRLSKETQSEEWRGNLTQKVTSEQSLDQVQGAGHGGEGAAAGLCAEVIGGKPVGLQQGEQGVIWGGLAVH